MAGSVRKVGPNKYRIEFMIDGQRYSENLEAKSEAEANRIKDTYIVEARKGLYSNTSLRVDELAQLWLNDKVKPNSGDRTVMKYKGHLNKRILPQLGHYRVNKISKIVLVKYFNELKESKTIYKTRKENKQVSPETVKKMKSIIHAMLQFAVDDLKVLAINPCSGIKLEFRNTKNEEQLKKLVNQKKKKVDYFTLEEYKNVCNLLENQMLLYYNKEISDDVKLREVGRRFLVLFDLKTGMRRSELFGLARNKEYNDLDIENRTFDVNKSRHYLKGTGKITKYPKNDSSIRTKKFSKSLVDFIKLYYKLLDEVDYKEMYIFEHLSIDGVCSWWDKWQDNNNIRNIRFHDIRHTHPTILLLKGVDMKTIQERLGHADITTTWNTYGHVLEELDNSAADKIDEI